MKQNQKDLTERIIIVTLIKKYKSCEKEKKQQNINITTVYEILHSIDNFIYRIQYFAKHCCVAIVQH